MVNYQNGQIYKLWSPLGDMTYIGSTTQMLHKRLHSHKSKYKGGKLKAQSRLLFEEYGIENVRIELIENFPCNSKTVLHRKEGEYIRKTNCVNKYIAGRTKNEWIHDNLQDFTVKKQQYYQKNSEKIIKRNHDRYHANKTEINANKAEKILCKICNYNISKNNYNEHKISKKHLNNLKDHDHNKYLKLNAKANAKLQQYTKRNEQKKEKITCECGAVVSKGNLARHKRESKKHQNYIASS